MWTAKLCNSLGPEIENQGRTHFYLYQTDWLHNSYYLRLGLFYGLKFFLNHFCVLVSYFTFFIYLFICTFPYTLPPYFAVISIKAELRQISLTIKVISFSVKPVNMGRFLKSNCIFPLFLPKHYWSDVLPVKECDLKYIRDFQSGSVFPW